MQIPALNTSLVQSSPTISDGGLARSLLSGETTTNPATPPTQQVLATAKTSRDEEKQPSAAESVAKLNQAISSFNRSLQFSIDTDTKINVVKVVDTTSKEVIRQIPTEEVIDIAKALDKLQGLLIRDKA